MFGLSIFLKKSPIIIASMGRSGSTLLNDVIAKVYKDRGFIIFHELQSGMKLKRNSLYKTHSHAQFLPKGDVKVIYLFGNPMNVVLSTYERTNLPQHFRHMDGDWENRDYYLEKDVLRLEENFDSFYQLQQFDLMTLRYETMYDHLKEIENFVCCHLKFPSFKKRKTDWRTSEFRSQLERTYGMFNQKIEKSEDIKVWESR
jgi:hypothetical protein